jgi:hypothetical protein
MNHSIKINRALEKAEVGKYPRTFEAILNSVPGPTITKLTSSELAELMDAIGAHAAVSKRLAEQEIIDEGAAWDYKQQRFREVH